MNNRLQMIAILVCAAGIGVYMGLKDKPKEKPAKQETKKNIFGATNTRPYKERSVGFVMVIPKNTTILDEATTKAMDAAGEKIIHAASPTAQTANKKGYKSKTLVRMQIPPAKQGVAQISPGLAIWHETTPEVLTDKDAYGYLMNLRRTMEASSSAKYSDKVLEKTLDGRQMLIQVCAIKVTPEEGDTLEGIQEQYVIIIEGNALGFSATYNNQDEAKILRDMAFSIRFDKTRNRKHEYELVPQKSSG